MRKRWLNFLLACEVMKTRASRKACGAGAVDVEEDHLHRLHGRRHRHGDLRRPILLKRLGGLYAEGKHFLPEAHDSLQLGGDQRVRCNSQPTRRKNFVRVRDGYAVGELPHLDRKAVVFRLSARDYVGWYVRVYQASARRCGILASRAGTCSSTFAGSSDVGFAS